MRYTLVGRFCYLSKEPRWQFALFPVFVLSCATQLLSVAYLLYKRESGINHFIYISASTQIGAFPKMLCYSFKQ